MSDVIDNFVQALLVAVDGLNVSRELWGLFLF